MDPSAALQTARESLVSLGNAVTGILSEYQDVIGDSLILEKLQAFQVAYEEAVTRLENPSFRIATIGTTSSGKSTIVNALIGREIAPIDAQEMSAGILRIKHSEQTRLVIQETKGATWECGTWENLSDKDIYNKLKHTMEVYHQEHKKKKNNAEAMVPEVDVECPLLPVRDPSLLNLPHGVGIEIYDLPGLNSIRDRSNLRVIQNHVSKCFSIVSLDYSQTDRSIRNKLLKELKNVVEFLNGNTGLMIFLLNRVDLRSQSDNLLEQTIDELRNEIKETLDLPEFPYIVPLSAQMLFYAQCAWGSNCSLSSDVDPVTRQWMLNAFFIDCAKLINSSTMENRELAFWLFNLAADIREGVAISDDDVRALLGHAREWSGGNLLWKLLRERLEVIFAEIVIIRDMIEVVNSAKEVSSALDILIRTQRIETVEEIEKQREYIQEKKESCKIKTEEIINRFVQDVTSLINLIAKSDESSKSIEKTENKIATIAKEKGWQRFPGFVDFIDDQVKDFVITIVTPIRDAMKQTTGIYDLEDSLAKVVPAPVANLVSRSCELTIRVLKECEQEGDTLDLKIQVESKDTKTNKKIEDAERTIRCLYQSVRKALEYRAEFVFQAKAQIFESFGRSLVSQLIEELNGIYVDSLDTLRISEAILNDMISYTTAHDLRVPEGEVFEFKAPVQVESTSEDHKKLKETRKSCLGGTTYETVIVGKRFYQKLTVPNFDGMARQWTRGIESGKEKLWDLLRDWLTSYVSNVKVAIQKSSGEISDLALRELDRQGRLIDDNFNERMLALNNLEDEKRLIEQSIQVLSFSRKRGDNDE